MTIALTMNMKQSFFDRQAVINAVERAEHRAMSRGLAFIRTSAKTRVLRRRKKASQPGKPPSVHSRDPVASLKNIWFAYDQRQSSGVVGPVRINGNRSAYSISSGGTVPALLEGGGSLSVTEERWKSGKTYGRKSGWRAVRKANRSDSRKEVRRRTVRVRPRPFMQVALDRVIDEGKISAAWAGVVTG